LCVLLLFNLIVLTASDCAYFCCST